MGCKSYDFLNYSFLFSIAEIENNFRNYTDEALHRELENYRNFILKNLKEIEQDITSNSSSLKVFSSVNTIPKETLIQSALYIEQFIIDDPLFKFTRQQSEDSMTLGKYIGYQDPTLDRLSLSSTLKFLKEITPMIAGDYIKLMPVSKLFEPQKNTPIYYSKNFFEDDLPRSIQQYCKKEAIVQSMKQSQKGEGWNILDEKDLSPGLLISYKDEPEFAMVYHYLVEEILSVNDEEMTYTATQTLADYPMDEGVWSAWVQQSINRTSINLVDKIYKEIQIAAKLSSTYMTNSPFVSGLLNSSMEIADTPETVTASQIMNLQLPYLDRLDINKLMDVRNGEQDIFINFRNELEKQFMELRFVTDKKELQQRRENIMHDLGVIQVRNINTKLNSLKKKAFFESAIMIGGLAGTVVTGGWSFIGAAVAGLSGYKTYIDYKENMKENPSYLMWKTLK